MANNSKKQKITPTYGKKNIILEAADVFKRIKTKSETLDVIKELNLIVREGDFVSILGVNSLGKDILLECLCGIEEIDKGSIFIEEKDITEISDSEKRKLRNEKLGIVFSNSNLIPTLNVYENIELPTFSTKIKSNEIKKQIDNLLEEFELKNKSKNFPEDLTKFESQKVSVCRALINNPKIIFCFEPMLELDTKSSEEFFNLLARINKEKNIAIVIITDNINIAARTSKLMRFENGKVNG